MKDLIGQLYGGEIHPAEQIIPMEPGYRPLTRKISEEREYFKRKLCEEDRKRLEKLHDMYMEHCSMECYAGFSYGFKLGAVLLMELLNDQEEGRE